MDEELENLREKSTRTSSIFDDLDSGGQGGRGAGLAGLTPQQRLILAFLLFLNVIACAAATMYIVFSQ